MIAPTCIHRRAPAGLRSPWRPRRSIDRRSFSRPSFAPRPLPDRIHIAQNPGLYQQNCIDRNYGKFADYAFRIASLRNENIRLDKEIKEQRTAFKQLQREIRKVQEDSGDAPPSFSWQKKHEDPQTLEEREGEGDSILERAKKRGRELKAELEAVTGVMSSNDQAIEQMALALPNLSSVHTPNGTKAKILDVVKNIPQSQLANLQKSHVDIGSDLGILNFNQSAVTSGWGWYFLKGEAALLEQALIQYTISELVKRGWQIVSPPTMVYNHIASACGFQPRDQNDEQQIYAIEQPQRDDDSEHFAHVLAGTAEIPLAGMYARDSLKEQDLPLKTAAVSRCYRAEAGARGADTKGLYRVHEFTKVEMFAWTMPDTPDDPTSGGFNTSASTTSQSDDIFREMIDIQRHILTELGLNFQVLEMPATDLGASATRKIDMEAFFPSRRDRDGGWGEVTSTSMCTDYQTRRLSTRLSRTGSGKPGFPYTLNGTALAVPRVLAAILECFYDDKRGCLTVPSVLKPWMHGIEVIEARKTNASASCASVDEMVLMASIN